MNLKCESPRRLVALDFQPVGHVIGAVIRRLGNEKESDDESSHSKTCARSTKAEQSSALGKAYQLDGSLRAVAISPATKPVPQSLVFFIGRFARGRSST
jgi:hypothetical protein